MYRCKNCGNDMEFTEYMVEAQEVFCDEAGGADIISHELAFDVPINVKCNNCEALASNGAVVDRDGNVTIIQDGGSDDEDGWPNGSIRFQLPINDEPVFIQ